MSRDGCSCTIDLGSRSPCFLFFEASEVKEKGLKRMRVIEGVQCEGGYKA